MSARRIALVDAAFNVLDADGNGAIEPAEVANRYDAARHPAVLAGKMTAEDVFREFLETFDVGGDVDGKVTPQEFRNYYRDVSASIDDDDYFELVMRNAWHLAGGEGWCENTSNLRVLATLSDGSQTVCAIDDDLGLEMPRDAAEVLRRLRAQGVDAVAVEGSAGGAASSLSDGPSTNAPRRTFREVRRGAAAGGGAAQTAAVARTSGKRMHGSRGPRL